MYSKESIEEKISESVKGFLTPDKRGSFLIGSPNVKVHHVKFKNAVRFENTESKEKKSLKPPREVGHFHGNENYLSPNTIIHTGCQKRMEHLLKTSIK